MPRDGRGYQRGLRGERPSVTIGKVCHRKVNVYTFLSAEENVFFVRSCPRRGIERSLSRSSLLSSTLFPTLFDTLFCQHSSLLLVFVNREREREKGRKEFFLWYFTLEIDFPFDSFVFLDDPLFCLPCFLDRINQRQSVLFYDVALLLFPHCWEKVREILSIRGNARKAKKNSITKLKSHQSRREMFLLQ